MNGIHLRTAALAAATQLILVAVPAYRAQPRAEAGVCRPDRRATAVKAFATAQGGDHCHRRDGPWSLAFLPDGRFLVTGNGEMRIIQRDGGTQSSPSRACPPSRSSARRACTMWCSIRISRAIARCTSPTSRPTRASPAAASRWQTLYDNVWSVPLAQRRVMKIGIERVARATLSRRREEPRRTWT